MTPPPPPPTAPSHAGGGGKKKGLLVGGLVSAMVLGIAGVGAGAYFWLAGGGPQPADAMPDTVDVYVRFDGDPSANQKVEIYRLLEQIPELKEYLDENDDLRESFVSAALESCEGVGWSDVEPWLGNRFGLGVDLDLPEDPRAFETMPEEQLFNDHVKFYFTAQVSSEGEAETALNDIFDACGAPADQRPGIAFHDGFAVLAFNQDLADEAVSAAASGSLSDRAEFTEAMNKLGDPGIVSGWASAEPFVDMFELYGPELFAELENDVYYGSTDEDWPQYDEPFSDQSSMEPAVSPRTSPFDDDDESTEEPPSVDSTPTDEDDPFGDDPFGEDPFADDPFGEDPFEEGPSTTDPFGDDAPGGPGDPFTTTGPCASDAEVISAITDAYAQQFEGIESFAFALRAQDSALELIGTAVYDESLDLGSSSDLGDLPEDTVVGFGMASYPESWQIDSGALLEMIGAEACMTADQIRAEISANTPLDFDADWETLQSSGWLFYMGSKNLERLDELDYGLTIADFDFAGALLSDDGSSSELVNRLVDWISTEAGFSLDVFDLDNGSAIGSNPEAAEALDGDGGLSGTDAFSQVIPEDEIHGGLFVNVGEIVDSIRSSSGGDDPFTEFLEPISAAGISWWADDNALIYSFRVGFTG